MKRFAVIMAGGAGERFWPVSRISKPKHLWDITNAGSCLLEQCFRRISKIIPPENILIITNKEQVNGIREACPFIREDRIIAEPFCRDTLAAVGTGAILAEHFAGEDALVATFPSDHVILDEAAFTETVEDAFCAASQGDVLVTVGIRPTYPATGFGYIQAGAQTDGLAFPCFTAEKFHEKPTLDKAQAYLAGGNFFWNAGMFFWKSSSVRKAITQHVPESASAFDALAQALNSGSAVPALLEQFYPQIEKKSIDFAVMEKADNIRVVPAKFDWDDVGTWPAAARHLPKDDSGNALAGTAFLKDASGNLVFDATAQRKTALFGVSGLVVVHTPDATLICTQERAEELKNLVKTLPPELR